MTSPNSTAGATGAPRRGGLALTVIAVAQLMVILDATIVNVALPSMQRALSLSTENLSWVVNAYTLTFGGFLLLGGRAGDILGRRRVFIGGVAVFALASLVGGLAPTSGVLLVARAVQGIGAAVVSPAVLSLIATTFHEEKERNRAFGVFAGVSGAGGAIGLLAGGVLTEWLSWRWVLFVNVPLGLALVLLAPLYIGESQRQPGRLDLAGAATSTGGMVALVYGFIRVSEGGWGTPAALLSFAVAAVLLLAFVLVEQRTSQPVTPLRMFADRNRASIYVISLALTGSLLGLFFFLTVFMQNVLIYTPLQAGLAFLPVSVSIIMTVSVTTKVLPRIGQRLPLVVGIALNAVALAWLSLITVDSGYLGSLLGPMLVFGVGTGLLFMPLTMIGVSGVNQTDAGAASGLLNAMQQVGGSLGLAVLVTVFGAATRGASGTPAAVLTSGASVSFLVSAMFAVVAFVVAVALVRMPSGPAAPPSSAGSGPAAEPARPAASQAEAG